MCNTSYKLYGNFEEVYKVLSKYVSKELLSKAYSLEKIGIYRIAWKNEDIPQVIEELVKNELRILGGDVIPFKNSIIDYPNGDTWYFNDDVSINETGQRTLDYIRKYTKKNGDDFLYTIVVDFLMI